MNEDSKSHNGFLFVLEGVDGAGKSVVCKSIHKLLVNEGYDAVILREPTDESEWGKEIRARAPKGELSAEEELDLFMRDREWNIKNRIGPALAAGQVVLMDRYFFATGAYQTVSTKIPWQEILRMHREDMQAPEPDLIILLDLDPETGLERILADRTVVVEQFEKIDRLVKVRSVYTEMAQEDSGNYFLVDATLALEEVISHVHKAILHKLKLP